MTNAEKWARKFHETYERLATQFGYETRVDTKRFDPDSPNGQLMIAVIAEVSCIMTHAEVARLTAEVERYKKALEQIANRPFDEMIHARTLHYDMRGWAKAALNPRDELIEKAWVETCHLYGFKKDVPVLHRTFFEAGLAEGERVVKEEIEAALNPKDEQEQK